MQENILYNAKNTDGISPQRAKIAARIRRQNSSSSHWETDCKYSVNTLTDIADREQSYLLAFEMIQSGKKCWWRQRISASLLLLESVFS